MQMKTRETTASHCKEILRFTNDYSIQRISRGGQNMPPLPMPNFGTHGKGDGPARLLQDISEGILETTLQN